MGTTPLWLTVLLAVLGPVVTLAGVWLSGQRQIALERVKQQEQRDQRAEQRVVDERRHREDSYARFLAAARGFAAAVEHGGDVTERLSVLREAVALVDLRAAAIADGPLVAVVGAAERVASLAGRGAGQALGEARQRFDRELITLRDAMRGDVGDPDQVIVSRSDQGVSGRR